MTTWIFVAMAAVVAWIADHTARNPEGDSGAFWAQTVERTLLIPGSLALLALCIPALLNTGSWFSLGAESLWPALVGGVWTVILAAGILVRPAPAGRRWLAGSLAFSPRRHWLLLLLVPLVWAAIYLWDGRRLPGYAVVWAYVIVACMSVAGAAFSARPARPVWQAAQEASLSPSHKPLDDWLAVMLRHGVSLRLVGTVKAGSEIGERTDPAEWAEACRCMGSPGVSNQMARAVAELAASVGGTGAQRLMLAPECAGQVELVAMAVGEISRRYGEISIVVTPSPDPELGAELAHWLERFGGDNPARVAGVAAGGSLDSADVLLVDAETLSEVVIDLLRVQGQNNPNGQTAAASRVGLVVWWDLQKYSGVPAAHLWAISRRLDRLLEAQGAIDRRVLALAIPSPYEQAQYKAFLRRLLPYEWSPGQEIEIANWYARETHFYAIEPPTRAATRVAAEISATWTGWPTYASPGTFIVPPPGLAARPVAASVRFLDVQPQDALHIHSLVCRGARCVSPVLPQHVVLTAQHNPYVSFLLESVVAPSEGASAHLAVAEGQPALIRRHLLLALREAPDTFAGLCAGFRWKSETWREALDGLAAEGLLNRRQVRHLNPDTGRVERDAVYENRQVFQAEPGSMRVLGSRPLEVRVPDAEARLALRVARERAAIEAYPLAVLYSGGQRFRVYEWDAGQDGEPPDVLFSRDEQADIRTWRMRTAVIAPLPARAPEYKPSPPGTQIDVEDVEYDETLRGIVELESSGIVQTRIFPAESPPLLTHLRTRALLLSFEGKVASTALRTVAAALRFALPVHVAYDEDSLEIVGFLNEGKPTIAIVELYEGGIQLVDGIVQNPRFIPDLLIRTLTWLKAASDAGQDADVVLGSHPLIRATAGPGRLEFSAALRLLESIHLAARAVGELP